ncbi:hypothetical protein ANO14919_012600 [Xylariales sp. No.14919]|nr:hypothetical protein ANO14919_012600 [Xylariales sp. No.14919]
MLLKVAILLQWTRLFVPRGTRGPFYWTCHSALWINILLYTSIVIAICVSCTPFAKLWDLTLPGICRANREIIDICTAVTNLASDLIILLLPQPVIWKLKLKSQKKIGIAFVFCVGVFAIVSAAFRVHASVRFFRSKDKTYLVSSVALWGIAELTCGILIYCMPSIPKIFRHSRLSFKSFKALAPSAGLSLELIRSWRGSVRTSMGSEKLRLGSFHEPKYDGGMALKPCYPEKVHLESHGCPAPDLETQQPQPSWDQFIV